MCRYELPRYIVRVRLETHSIRVGFFGGTILKQLRYIGLLCGAFWRRGFPGHFSKTRLIYVGLFERDPFLRSSFVEGSFTVQFVLKRALNLRKRVLHLRKRALDLREEPYVLGKFCRYPKKSPTISANEPDV